MSVPTNSTQARRLQEEQRRWLRTQSADNQGFSPGRIRTCTACTKHTQGLPLVPQQRPATSATSPARVPLSSSSPRMHRTRPEAHVLPSGVLISGSPLQAARKGFGERKIARVGSIGSLGPDGYLCMENHDGERKGSKRESRDDDDHDQLGDCSPSLSASRGSSSPQRLSSHGSYYFAHNVQSATAMHDEVVDPASLIADIEAILSGSGAT